MPKERRERSASVDRARPYPFPCSSSRSKHSSSRNRLEDEENTREWEVARCPVCMEHPHNAILLMCSSHEKGCRPFMCDTSYRHSNCFDQFRRSCGGPVPTPHEDDISNSSSHFMSTSATSEAAGDDSSSARSDGVRTPVEAILGEGGLKSKMVCPLCRGQINGWKVVESARRFMNAKSRGCSCETCDFSGTYSDLRKHARSVHPLVRPTEANPEREHNWRRLERQTDFGDLLSTLQSSMEEENSDYSTLAFGEGGLLTVLFLVQVFQPDGASRRRAQVTIRRRASRRLWGETYDGENVTRDDDNEDSDGGVDSWRHTGRSGRQPTPES